MSVKITASDSRLPAQSFPRKSLANDQSKKSDHFLFRPADPGTQLREKRASSVYKCGNSQGWLIRATGCYLMQHKTPTSRSIGNKAVLLGISGRVEQYPLVPEGRRVSGEIRN